MSVIYEWDQEWPAYAQGDQCPPDDIRATGVGHERGNLRAVTRLDVGKICSTIGCAMAVLIAGRFAMVSAARSGMIFLAVLLMAGLATAACAQQPQYPNPADLPNPDRLVE